MRKRRIFATLLAASMAFALFAAGCGGGGDDPDKTDPDDTTDTTDPTDPTDPDDKKDPEQKPGDGTVDTSTKFTGKIYVVGDSTVCSFNDKYYIPRYGYGTQLYNYFNLESESQIVNLALSGRSSWSFTQESNYAQLSNIKEGDYLIIGFGHNDQKDDIYTNPNLATDSDDMINGVIDNKTISHYASFKRSLYENYVKVAEEAHATAILCTPIVRLNDKDDYTGNSAHVRTKSDGEKNPGGNWPGAIRELGEEKGVTVVDLTALTAADYAAKGYAEASKYHAYTGAKWADSSKTEKVPAGLDGTHTNLYGAKMNAYYIADALKASDNSIAKHVKTNIEKPTYDKDYAAGVVDSFVPSEYTPFDPAKSAKSVVGTLSESGWYATAFGSLGGSPTAAKFKVTQNQTQDESLSFTVKDDSTSKIKGDEDGLVCAFTQLASNATFKIEADVVVDTYKDNDTQTGFGIMLRDDIYIDTNDKTILTDYAAAGVYGKANAANVLYTRVNGELTPVNSNQTVDVTASKTHKVSIERSGKTVTVTFDGLSKQYPDFDLVKVDTDYMYICLYAVRGTTVTFNNVKLEITGTSEA